MGNIISPPVCFDRLSCRNMIPLIAGCTRRERDRHSRHVILCRKACDEQRSKLPRRISRKARHGALCISRAIADQNEHLSSPKGQPVPLRRVISSHPHARRKRGCPQFFDPYPRSAGTTALRPTSAAPPPRWSDRCAAGPRWKSSRPRAAGRSRSGCAAHRAAQHLRAAGHRADARSPRSVRRQAPPCPCRRTAAHSNRSAGRGSRRPGSPFAAAPCRPAVQMPVTAR